MFRYTTLWKSKLLLSVCCAHDVQPVCRGFGRRVEAGRYRPDLSSLIKEQRWTAPTTVTCSCHNRCCQWCWRASRVLRLSTGQRSCTPSTWHCATSWASNTCFHSTGSVAAKQSRPQSSWLQDGAATSVSITGAQRWRTQAALGARLARHHWHCSWRVAWPS